MKNIINHKEFNWELNKLKENFNTNQDYLKKYKWIYIINVGSLIEDEVEEYITSFANSIEEPNTMFIPTRTADSSINMINLKTGKVERFYF